MFCQLPLPWMLLCLFCTDNYFMDSFHRYLHCSPFKSLLLFLSPLCVSLSLPIVSFVLQTEQWYCLSEAHLFPSAPAGCQAISAMAAGISVALVDTWKYHTNPHRQPFTEHRPSNHNRRCKHVCSIRPHLDLTQDPSLVFSQLIDLDRCVFAWAFILMHISFEAVECNSETRA